MRDKTRMSERSFRDIFAASALRIKDVLSQLTGRYICTYTVYTLYIHVLYVCGKCCHFGGWLTDMFAFVHNSSVFIVDGVREKSSAVFKLVFSLNMDHRNWNWEKILQREIVVA